MSQMHHVCKECEWYLLYNDFYFYEYCRNPECKLKGEKQ